MSPLAHVGALPVEELLGWLLTGGAATFGGARLYVGRRRPSSRAGKARPPVPAPPAVPTDGGRSPAGVASDDGRDAVEEVRPAR
jgi:hypothetical protein